VLGNMLILAPYPLDHLQHHNCLKY
jgi:hypothetical protein